MSHIKTIIVYFKELPQPVKYSTYFYLGTLFFYNSIMTYHDSKNKLLDYRNNILPKNEKELIKNEWEAVKYGANENLTERFFKSIFWPINIISDIIPLLVLTLNKK